MTSKSRAIRPQSQQIDSTMSQSRAISSQRPECANLTQAETNTLNGHLFNTHFLT